MLVQDKALCTTTPYRLRRRMRQPITRRQGITQTPRINSLLRISTRPTNPARLRQTQRTRRMPLTLMRLIGNLQLIRPQLTKPLDSEQTQRTEQSWQTWMPILARSWPTLKRITKTNCRQATRRQIARSTLDQPETSSSVSRLMIFV